MRALPEIFFFAIVFYVLYRFIFNFVVPVARTTRQVRQQFRNMQEMHEHGQEAGGQGAYGQGQTYGGHGAYGQGQGSYERGQAYGGQRYSGQAQTSPNGSAQQRKPNSDNIGEYIDFEEVK